MTRFQCTCGQKLKVAEQYAGKKVVCPKCRRGLVVPQSVPSAPPVEEPVHTDRTAAATSHIEQPSGPTQAMDEIPGSASDTKACPYCGEQIKVVAVVCRFCGINIETGRPVDSATAKPRAEPSESETQTCIFCHKPMPLDAIQCASCQNWRQDIHRLIDTYCKLALGQYAAMMIGGLFACFVFVNGARQPNARTTMLFSSEFSFEKFVSTPSFAIGVVFVVLTMVVWAVMQVPAAGTRRRIQQATKGLWKRPWWTY